MAWRNIDELMDDVFSTLVRLRASEVPIKQAWVEAKLLDTGARLMTLKYPRPFGRPEMEAAGPNPEPAAQNTAPLSSAIGPANGSITKPA